MTLRMDVLYSMLAAEETASKRFTDMTSREQQAYIKAHPHSKYAKHAANPNEHKKVHDVLTQHGWKPIDKNLPRASRPGSGFTSYEHPSTGPSHQITVATRDRESTSRLSPIVRKGSWQHKKNDYRSHETTIPGEGRNAAELHEYLSSRKKSKS